MKKFYKLLLDLDRKLKISEKEKDKFLTEISADLEDLYQTFRNEGYSKTESEVKAIEYVDLSEEALNDLHNIHLDWTDKLMNKITFEKQTSIISVIVFTPLILLFLYFTFLFFFNNIIDYISPLFIPSGFIAIILLWIIIRKILDLYKYKKKNNLRKYIKSYFILMLLNLVTGFYALLTEIYVSGKQIFDNVFSIIRVNSNIDILDETVLLRLQSSAIIVFSFVSTIFFVIVWLILVSKINIEEKKRIESFFSLKEE